MRELSQSEIGLVAGGEWSDDTPENLHRRGGSRDTGAEGDGGDPNDDLIDPEILWNDSMYDKPAPDPDGPRDLLPQP